MNKFTKLATVSALAISVSAAAFAQNAVSVSEALDDQIDDTVTAVNDEIEKGNDSERFGAVQAPAGWTGSLALGISAVSGNSDTTDFSLAGKGTYGAGAWNHSLGFAAEYGESDGVANKEKAYLTYDANRYFSDNFYGFVLGSVQYDGYATNELDAIVAFGPGYRVINNENMTWRVQAGPGFRYIKLADEALTGASFDDIEEAAGIVSSRFYTKVSANSFLTMDTDIVYSDASMDVTNDLGMNYKLSDNMAARIGYRTDYTDTPAAGAENADNTFGLSLVMGF